MRLEAAATQPHGHLIIICDWSAVVPELADLIDRRPGRYHPSWSRGNVDSVAEFSHPCSPYLSESGTIILTAEEQPGGQL